MYATVLDFTFKPENRDEAIALTEQLVDANRFGELAVVLRQLPPPRSLVAIEFAYVVVETGDPNTAVLTNHRRQ